MFCSLFKDCGKFDAMFRVPKSPIKENRIFVVTGSQRGIGYGIVKLLAERIDHATIYMTDTHECMLKESLKNLKKELGDKQKSHVCIHQLDITNKSMIEKFSKHLKDEHGGFDVLVNNAGIRFNNPMGETLAEARQTLAVNYEGTKLVTTELIHIMKSGGRIVNVTTRGGIIRNYPSDLRVKLCRPSITIADIDAYVADFLKAYEEKTCRSKGLPESAYRVSKTAEILLTVVWAREYKSKKIVVNACCPGYVKTGMSVGMGDGLSVEEGADTPFYLATLTKDSPNGEFLYLRRLFRWY